MVQYAKEIEMRSETELMTVCREVFNYNLNSFLTHLKLKAEHNLIDGNLLSAKYYLEDVKTLNGMLAREEKL